MVGAVDDAGGDRRHRGAAIHGGLLDPPVGVGFGHVVVGDELHLRLVDQAPGSEPLRAQRDLGRDGSAGDGGAVRVGSGAGPTLVPGTAASSVTAVADGGEVRAARSATSADRGFINHLLVAEARRQLRCSATEESEPPIGSTVSRERAYLGGYAQLATRCASVKQTAWPTTQSSTPESSPTNGVDAAVAERVDNGGPLPAPLHQGPRCTRVLAAPRACGPTT